MASAADTSGSRTLPMGQMCSCALPTLIPPHPPRGSLLHIDDLPDEILVAVFHYLSCFEYNASVPLVCWRWRRVNSDGAVLPQRACDPCATDPPATKSTVVCKPVCPLAHVRVPFRLAMGLSLPANFGTCERPSATVFLLYALYYHTSTTKRPGFPVRCRPIDARPCEEAARLGGDAGVVSLLECGWPSSPRVFAWCAVWGSTLDRLLALVLAGCPIDDPMVGTACAWCGRADVLSLLVGLGAAHTVDASAWKVAAMRGHIEWMVAARAHGFTRPSQECAQAAAWAGHFDIVMWAQDECDRSDPSIVTGAVASGTNVASLVALVGAGWAVAPDAIVEAARRGVIDVIAFVWSVLDARRVPACHSRSLASCIEAAREGHLDCLAYLWMHGCPWDGRVCAAAASNGHLDCLIYARENGCLWDANTCRMAAAGGHYACLVYAYENGCPWEEGTCEAASAGGHLACLAYAHQNGCLWDERTTIAAATNGYLLCLAYAHEHDCPWDFLVVDAALEGKHRDCVAYAHRHGCPCKPSACLVVCLHERWDVEAVCGRPCPKTHSARRRMARLNKGPPSWAAACAPTVRDANHDPWNRLLNSLSEHRGAGSFRRAAAIDTQLQP
ncbi:ankyrin repeat protein [Pandoravirus inopinatum]|uniref:Ankyrin repeat protein n=1 Tax=Pandoravirus inopinatum TaxID=1605721 RepID=A0A0B5J206_9VIRU|nr:ankyrin repeat protein [Pandoravirus inopinatum]AJF97579.1 ankyrin repeat protein [Pandoravirus inopinatum]